MKEKPPITAMPCRKRFLMKESLVKKVFIVFVLLIWVSGCAGHRAFLSGEALMAEGKYDEAVAKYFQAVTENPKSKECQLRLLEAKSRAALGHLKEGRSFVKKGNYGAAVNEFGKAAALDPSIEAIGQELEQAQEFLRAEKLIQQAEGFYQNRKFNQAQNTLEQALQLNPDNREGLALFEKVKRERRTVIDGFELDVISDKPITLKFKDANVRDVFTVLFKLSGINFIFDEDVGAQKVTVFLEEATFAQTLELLLGMNNFGKKVLNAKTIIVYPKTMEKEKQYQDQIIQTFYLSNIDAKKAVNLLRTMLQLRKIYVHEELNALILRDKPDVVKLAQQIIEAADREDSEVTFDLELIEVSHTDGLLWGPSLNPYSVSLGLAKGDNVVASGLESGKSTANLVESFSRLESVYTLPSASFDFAKTLVDSEVLANPKIRVKNKEKANVHVGTREPVITVTTTGETSSDNIQYVDVGVKLDVEPTIQLDDTVVTKLSLEVSSVTEKTITANGSLALTISTTNAQTSLTLKNGERTVIGGLIRDDNTKTRKTIPFLGRLPIVGHLLTNYNNSKGKREILLSITPHIVSKVDMPRADVATIWSGGEDDLKAGPSFGSFADTFEPQVDMAFPSPVPAVKDGASQSPRIPSVKPASPAPAMLGQEAPSVEVPASENINSAAGRPPAWEPESKLTSPAELIESVDVRDARAVFSADGSIEKYRYFTLGGPLRLVVDIYGVQPNFKERSYGASLGFRQIRVGIYKDKTRFVFDVEGSTLPEHTVEKKDNAVIVSWGLRIEPAAGASPKAAGAPASMEAVDFKVVEQIDPVSSSR